jgi:hypothetical protein
MARLAYGMALAGDKVSAEVIDAEEFPSVAREFKVGPVPKTLLNYQSEFLGAAPEAYVLEKILTAPPPLP